MAGHQGPDETDTATRTTDLEDDVQGVDDAGDVTGEVQERGCQSTTRTRECREGRADAPEDGQEDVDEEVGAATTLEEDTERGEEDRENDLADLRGPDRGGRASARRILDWQTAALSERR